MPCYAVTCSESFADAASPEEAAISLVRRLRDDRLSCVTLIVSGQGSAMYDVDVFIDERTGEPYCETETTEGVAP